MLSDGGDGIEYDTTTAKAKPPGRFYRRGERPVWARVLIVGTLLAVAFFGLAGALTVVDDTHTPPYLAGIKAQAVQMFHGLNEARRSLLDAIH